LQQVLQRRAGLLVAFLGVVERDLRAGNLARDVGKLLLGRAALERAADPLLERGVLRLLIGIAAGEALARTP
jgi:hypothetical protein